MEQPIAFKFSGDTKMEAYSIKLDPNVIPKGRGVIGSHGPAILISQRIALLGEHATGVMDAKDIVAKIDGDWSRAILIVLPEQDSSHPQPNPQPDQIGIDENDDLFIQAAAHASDGLRAIAEATITAIRESGVEGHLIKTADGKWINRPVNCFTLKIQPRKGDIRFTLYGEPHNFDDYDFLKKDQNSYSAGKVKSIEDAERLATLARISFDRKRGFKRMRGDQLRLCLEDVVGAYRHQWDCKGL